MSRHTSSLGPVGRLIQVLLDLRVAAGPFAGMKYLKEGLIPAYLPKLLGTYEKELWPAWRLMTGTCRGGTLVNIGAAEGYYAVGALYSGAFERVICYEQDASIRQLIAELARLNGIQHKLDIGAQCKPGILGEQLSMITLPVAILCDAEGDEDVLLDPVLIAKLACCHLLVELHEANCPGVTARLLQRFQATHQITFIPLAPRIPADLPTRPRLLTYFPRRNKLRWLHEGRISDTPWLLLTPIMTDRCLPLQDDSDRKVAPSPPVCPPPR